MAPYRAHVMGTRHMVAAGHYLAAQAGLQVLEGGGNAVDAGVAGGIALGVVLSEFVGFAGVAPITLYLAERREVITISGLGWWPKAASAEYFRREHGGRIPPGIMRTVVPAAPDAWITALERYGTIGFGEAASAAIRLARDGFPISALTCAIIADRERQYARWESNAAIYLPRGRPPRPGELFVQRDLAGTMQHMADEEAAAARHGGREAGLRAARDAFYRGDIAKAITDYHAEHGGWLTMEDMAGFRVGVEPPVRTTFRGIEVYGCGPWCQGPVLLQTLNILDGVDLEGLGHNTPAYVHVLVEAMKLAFADRHRYYGDPRHVAVPIDALLDRGYAARRRALIRPDAAAPAMPEPGSPAELGLADETGVGGVPEPTPGFSAMKLDTSYVCVVDRWGNAFSATPSDGSSEAPLIPGTGIVPSPRGVQSWTDPAAPACLAPGKRPRLTPNPAVALGRGGEVVMPFGSPGNDVQAQAMAQVFLNVQVFGMAPQEAVEQPRFATFSYPRSTDPHEYNPGKMSLERRVGDDAAEALGRLGHEVAWWPEYEWRAGAVCTIVADRGRGVLAGGADPRRPTAVAGW